MEMTMENAVALATKASGLELFGAFSAALLFIYALASSVLYVCIASHASFRRRRAWILCAVNATVCTAVGLRFAALAFAPESTEWPSMSTSLFAEGSMDAVLARALAIFIIAYSCVDTLCCLLHYMEELEIGLKHHATYAALCVYLLYTDRTQLVAYIALEELPVALRSMHELFGDQRPRLTIGVSAFIFRITWHVWITFRVAGTDSFELYCICIALLVQHIGWFRTWFTSRLTIVREQASGEQAAAAAKLSTASKRNDLSMQGTPPKRKKEKMAKTTKTSKPVVTPPPSDTEEGGSESPRGKARRLQCREWATEGSAFGKELSFRATTHVYTLSALLACLTTMLCYFMFLEVRELTRHDGWTERDAVILGKLAVHITSFLAIFARLVTIVQEVYMEHFIMHTIGNKTIIYNISWEDPKVERELLNMGPSDVVLTISSAGCNVLDYMITGAHVVACDFNQAQLSMLELKLCCIQHLDYDQFFALWGESNFDVFTANYGSKLRPHLSDMSKAFWDANGHLFEQNIMFAGTSGLAARMLEPAFILSGLRKHMIEGKKYPPASIGLTIVRKIMAQTWMWSIFAPLGGVPQSQLDLVKRNPEIFKERLEEVVGHRMWSDNNYFYYGYIVGKWSKECCPRYMREEHFATLKANVHNCTIHHGPIAEAAKLRDDFTIASLLDSMDWMPDSMIAHQLSELVPQMKAGGSIYWRCFGDMVHSPVLSQLEPVLVPTFDRVGWYLTQWVAKVPDKKEGAFGHFLEQGSGAQFSNTACGDVSVMAAMAVHGLRKTKDVRAFYKSQGANYDGFRESLLPRRNVAMQYGIPWQRAPKTWVSVGCGTARDIEFVLGHLKAVKTKLYLLDLSPELLAMAEERVDALGLGEQVTCVVADITAKGAIKGLPPRGSVDLVTCSYCLTMIPSWREAIDAMISFLRPDGTLGIIDFTRRTDCPDTLRQRFNQWWFAHDGVYFDEAQPGALRTHPKLKETWFSESESRVPWTPMVATNYIYYGRKVSAK